LFTSGGACSLARAILVKLSILLWIINELGTGSSHLNSHFLQFQQSVLLAMMVKSCWQMKPFTIHRFPMKLAWHRTHGLVQCWCVWMERLEQYVPMAGMTMMPLLSVDTWASTLHRMVQIVSIYYGWYNCHTTGNRPDFLSTHRCHCRQVLWLEWPSLCRWCNVQWHWVRSSKLPVWWYPGTRMPVQLCRCSHLSARWPSLHVV
jgi:hypothetical protein